jgi:SulP family sulfate permease
MDTTGLVALEDIYHDLERHNCCFYSISPQVIEYSQPGATDLKSPELMELND